MYYQYAFIHSNSDSTQKMSLRYLFMPSVRVYFPSLFEISVCFFLCAPKMFTMQSMMSVFSCKIFSNRDFNFNLLLKHSRHVKIKEIIYRKLVNSIIIIFKKKKRNYLISIKYSIKLKLHEIINE